MEPITEPTTTIEHFKALLEEAQSSGAPSAYAAVADLIESDIGRFGNGWMKAAYYTVRSVATAHDLMDAVYLTGPLAHRMYCSMIWYNGSNCALLPEMARTIGGPMQIIRLLNLTHAQRRRT